MESVKIILKLKSPVITPFLSDTILGHFAWGVAFLKGENELKKLLSDFESSPFIVFSDGFESGKFPKPYLEPYLMPVEYMDLNKKYKKAAFVNKEWIFKNIDNLTDEKIFESFITNKKIDNPCVEKVEKKPPKDKESVLELKNSIDRLINKTTQGLYSIESTFYKKDFEIELYAKYNKEKIDLNTIKEVLDFIGKRGYGKDKSTGKGKFECEIIEDFEEKSFFEIDEKRNFFLSLSTMFRCDDLIFSYGKKFTKFPKTGGSLAYSRPFKNPIIMYKSGSTFLIKNFKEYYGSAKDNVFNENGYYHSGYGIGIYFGAGA